jgi:hypothetical protein
VNSQQTLQNDPNLKLPAAVLAAAARSEEIAKQMQGSDADGAGGAGDAPPDQVTQPSNSELSPESLAQAAGSQQEQPSRNAPADDEQSWEHKYKSLHGRYTRQNEQIKDLTDQITSLQNVISTMQVAAPSAPLPEVTIERLITPEEANDYGEEFLNVVGKRAREELAPVIKGYETKIAELEKKLQGVNGVFVQDAHEKLLATLDEKLPDWRALNTNEEFLSWLSLPDPYSGVKRHDMLKTAYAQGDARRVLVFFNGFLAEEAATAPAQARPDTPVTTVPKVPLTSLAAPGRAKTAASTTAPAEKPIFTRAQIAMFYADVAAQKYKGRDAEKSKLEAQIFEAQRDGRIR